MGHRFYVDSPIAGGRVLLTGAESHHLQHVMRAAVGDNIVLFDGTGNEFSARIDRITRSQVELSVIESRAVDRELPFPMTIGVALPKGERQRWLVEKMVELGVTRLVPLRTRHSIVHPDTSGAKKLHRTVIEASKQCGRNRCMEVASCAPFVDFARDAPHDALRWIAHPDGNGPTTGSGAPQCVYLAIGPEGGFTQDEVASAESVGWHVVTLGNRILRIETACLVMATLASLR